MKKRDNDPETKESKTFFVKALFALKKADGEVDDEQKEVEVDEKLNRDTPSSERLEKEI